MATNTLPLFLFTLVAAGLGTALMLAGKWLAPSAPDPVKGMPYESGVDPIHDTRRRFDIRFHLLAIAFLVFDVELFFLYPWAVASRPVRCEAVGYTQTQEATEHVTPKAATKRGETFSSPAGIDAAVEAGRMEHRHVVFFGAMGFLALVTLGFVYDWRKGVFDWR